MRRFLRHRPAPAALGVLAAIVLLSISSVGVAGSPGWWGGHPAVPGALVDGGRPTLDVLAAALDGDGFAFGPHPFGQDDVGRDWFTLTMLGVQRSLSIALIAGFVSTAVGVLLGTAAGLLRGRVEGSIMRFTDVVLSLPVLVLAAVLGRTTGGGPVALAVMIGLVSWTSLARLTRAAVLSLREREFVEAARGLGAGPVSIVVRQLLPHLAGTVAVNATLTVATAVLLETSLSYLGLGVRPPDTSLGTMISDNKDTFWVRPWLFWWPGSFVVAITLAVNFVGDGLRDTFDPRR